MNPHVPCAAADDSGHGGLQILVSAGPARFVGDEPVDLGGLGLGPTPHEIMGAALAACTAQTLRLYAKRKAWALGAVHIEVNHRRLAGETPADVFERRISLGGDLNDDQRERLMRIAEMCPIHRLLTAGARIVTEGVIQA